MRQLTAAGMLPESVRVDASSAMTVGPWLVIIASTFNLVFCFFNTRHWLTIGSGGIIVFELTILAAGVVSIKGSLSKGLVEITLLVSLYLVAVQFMNPGIDLKILHDLGVMVIFYRLGCLTPIETANRLLWIVMLIVLAAGFFELLLPNVFGNVFDIWSYYVNKGVLDQSTVKLSDSNLFLSGNRGGDAVRTFFPQLLGSHRVSSIFLEPDSLGNFAVIAFAWCLSTASGSRRSRALLLLCACLCFVLPDSRFASICCLIMLSVRIFLPSRSNLVVFMIPVGVLLALMIAGSISPMPGGLPPAITSDDFSGRLIFSGRLLDSWHLPQWFGLAPSAVYTADTGYAYMINNLGLPVTLLLLGCFAWGFEKDAEAKTMKTMVSIYFATALCVGASVFTIKTAALLWFLYGSTNAQAFEPVLLAERFWRRPVRTSAF